MASRGSLYVDPKLADEINSSQSFRLAIPPDAKQRGIGDQASYTWMELFEILDSVIEKDENNALVDIFKVTVRVPDDSPYETNVGKPANTWWFRTNASALATGDKDDKQRKMTMISVGKLKGLAKATGVALDDSEGYDLWPIFDKVDGQSPLKGLRFFARMKDKPDEDRDGAPIRRQEPTQFISESEGN